MPLPFAAGPMELLRPPPSQRKPHQHPLGPYPIPPLAAGSHRQHHPKSRFKSAAILHLTTADAVSSQLDSIGDPTRARQSHGPYTLQLISSNRKAAPDQIHRLLACALLLCLIAPAVAGVARAYLCRQRFRSPQGHRLLSRVLEQPRFLLDLASGDRSPVRSRGGSSSKTPCGEEGKVF